MNTITLVATVAAMGLLAFGVASCRSSSSKAPNQKLAGSVDLERFMGVWYVHGHTPTFMDKEAYDATETYELQDDGKIQTTYRFRKGGHDGDWKRYRPVGWVHDTESNAEWRMRFFGVFTAPYYILYVDDAHGETVVGHPNKELAWIMTRSPEISEADYLRLRSELETRGYAMDELSRVEHARSGTGD